MLRVVWMAQALRPGKLELSLAEMGRTVGEWLQRAGRRVGLHEWSRIILLLVGHHASLVVVGGGHWGKCQIGVVTNVRLVEINKE